MIQIFGDFRMSLPETEEYLVISFSSTAVPLKQRWRNNSLSADFLASYLTIFFPEHPIQDKLAIRGTVSYIANELLENAMKFSNELIDAPVSIRLQLHSDQLIFIVTNSLLPSGVDGFQALIQKLINTDTSELYINQLEENALGEKNVSCLGLLTMMLDYEAELGWRFDIDDNNPQDIRVTTMATLRI